jgi:hypothetical protein
MAAAVATPFGGMVVRAAEVPTTPDLTATFVTPDVWPESITSTVEGVTSGPSCTYVSPTFPVPPGLVGEEREVAFDATTCTFTVERRVVTPDQLAPRGTSATGPGPIVVPVTGCGAPVATEPFTILWGGYDFRLLPCYDWMETSSPPNETGSTWSAMEFHILYGTTSEQVSDWPLAAEQVDTDYDVYNGCANDDPYSPPNGEVYRYWNYDSHVEAPSVGITSSCGAVTTTASSQFHLGPSSGQCAESTVTMTDSTTGDNVRNTTSNGSGATVGALLPCLLTASFEHFVGGFYP